MEKTFQDGDRVRDGIISVYYSIRGWTMDDETVRFDWVTSTGDEADELYDSWQAAEQDVRSRYGG